MYFRLSGLISDPVLRVSCLGCQTGTEALDFRPEMRRAADAR